MNDAHAPDTMAGVETTDRVPERVPVAACPACAAPERRFELVAHDVVWGHAFDLVRCLRCGLVYVDPRPEGEALARYYADYYGARHPIFKNFFMSLRVRKLGAPPPNGRLLDIGCGRGDFIRTARRAGWRVFGIEHGAAPIMDDRAALPFQIGPPEALPTLPAASFDAVTFWHVLEHLPEPREQLREVHRLLKPGGRVIVEVPNFGGWQARLGRADWYHVDVPRHLLHFGRDSLVAVLAAAGFEPERWETLSLEYDAFGAAQTMLNRVCAQPNHLFQLLIRQPTAGGLRDTLASVALLPFAGIAAVVLTAIAALARQGGVLRVTARKRVTA